MKKITLLVLLVMSLGVFAASTDLSAKGSLYVNPQGSKTNDFTLGQTDLFLSAANKDVSVSTVFALNTAVNPVTKYFVVETKVFGGKLQGGRINPIVSDYFAPGFYGDSSFFLATGYNMVGNGLSFETGAWTVAYTGAATLLNGPSTQVGKLGIAYNADKMGKYAIIMKQNKVAGLEYTDYDLLVEYGTAFGDLALTAQVLWGLQAQSAAQKQAIALYANYTVDAKQAVYGIYYDDLAGMTLTKALSLGYTYMVNSSVTAVVDYTNTMETASAGETVSVGLSFGL